MPEVIQIPKDSPAPDWVTSLTSGGWTVPTRNDTYRRDGQDHWSLTKRMRLAVDVWSKLTPVDWEAVRLSLYSRLLTTVLAEPGLPDEVAELCSRALGGEPVEAEIAESLARHKASRDQERAKEEAADARRGQWMSEANMVDHGLANPPTDNASRRATYCALCLASSLAGPRVGFHVYTWRLVDDRLGKRHLSGVWRAQAEVLSVLFNLTSAQPQRT